MKICFAAVLCVTLMAGQLAQAQLRIGQTTGLTGPVAAGAKENTEGAKLWFDHVNAKGGVHGEKIDLISLDDKFDAKLAHDNALKLIAEHNVLALCLNRGTPHTEAIMPLLALHKIALIAPSTGAMALHSPVNPYIFNVRSTYQAEARTAIKHLATLGLTQIAVVHVADSFGRDGLAGAMLGFADANLKPLAVETYDRVKPVLEPIVPKVQAAQAVIIIASATQTSDMVKLLRQAGSKTQVITLSNNASGGFVKQLGEHARGVVVAQVFPNERTLSMPIIREAVDLARAKNIELTPAMMEGYAGAKVVVEALKRAGPKPTREKVLAALDNIRIDLGGLIVDYSVNDHTGLDFVELSIIDAQGRFRR